MAITKQQPGMGSDMGAGLTGGGGAPDLPQGSDLTQLLLRLGIGMTGGGGMMGGLSQVLQQLLMQKLGPGMGAGALSKRQPAAGPAPAYGDALSGGMNG
jgi:hypothetical protein